MNLEAQTVASGAVFLGTAEFPRAAATKALAGAALFLVGETKKRTPVGATGNLRSTVSSDEVSSIGDGLITSVHSDSLYGMIVEEGGKPHWPVFSKGDDGKLHCYPLEYWATRKLGISDPKELRSVGFLIARKISRQGTSSRGVRPGPTGGRGYYMFEEAFLQNVARINTAFFEPLGLQLVRALE